MDILDQALDTGHWNEDKDPDNMIVGERGQRDGNVGNSPMEAADTTVAVVNIVGGVVLALAILGIVLPSCLIHGARTVGTATVCCGQKGIVLSYQQGVVICIRNTLSRSNGPQFVLDIENWDVKVDIFPKIGDKNN